MKKEDLIKEVKNWYENGECYTRFDSDKFFRREAGLGNHIKQVDKLAYNRYYE